MIQFTVYGRPAQQGSKRAFVRNGRAILTEDNSDRQRQWYNAVASRAAEYMNGRDLIQGPLRLSVEFRFKRPKSHFGSGKNASVLKASAPVLHEQTPDISKLIRCTEDAMSGVVYGDDRQICEYGSIRRVWTMNQECAVIEIEELTQERAAS